MKKLISLLLTLMMICVSLPALAEEEPAHILVAYFSRAGENYNVGVIEKGNTEKMAEIIAEQLGADLFRIETAVAYPEDYEETKAIATREYQNDERPALASSIENWNQYDTVLIGYPIWWAGMPMAVYTFLESYDFAGKIVIPFNTHEGSGQAGTQQVIEEKLTGATVLNGLAIRGSKAQNDAEGTARDVSDWLNSLGLAQ